MMKSKYSILLFPIVNGMDATYIAYYKIYNKNGYMRGDYNYNLKEVYINYVTGLYANY